VSIPEKEIDLEAIKKFEKPLGGEVWAMPIVVFDDPESTQVGVLSSVCEATASFLHETESNSEIKFLVEKWENTRQVRKIVRRAKGSQWNRSLDTGFHVVREYKNKGKAAVFAPHPADETPLDIKRLQMSGFKTVERGIMPNKKYLPTIFVSPHVQLSLGKMSAQVAHAAHFLYRESTHEKREEWRVRGEFKANIEFVESPFWDIIVSDHTPDIEVRDGGYTEIPKGTRTVVAFWDNPLNIDFKDFMLTKWFF
jgi:peptidyl-tRNA hydrolase